MYQQQAFSQDGSYDWSDPQHFSTNMNGELTYAQLSMLRISRPNKRRILYGLGSVTIERNKYKVQLSSQRTLKLPDGQLKLAPGQYEFHYLDKSYTLLSALPLRATLPLQPDQRMREYIDRVLQNLLDFTEQDVIANIERYLSEKQRKRLERLAKWDIFGFVLIFLFGIGFIVLGAFIFSTAWLATACISGIGLITALFAFGFLQTRSRRLKAIEHNSIEVVEGIIEKERKEHKSEDSTTYSYHFLVGGKDFTVNEYAYNALDPDPRYRIYYVPGSNDFLSMEMTEPPQRSHDFPLNF